ncbi:hypothetical protein ACLOAV_005183 [Pseudogymnoascus australis]
MAPTKLPHLRHKYTTALRARRNAHRTRLLERQELAQHRRWARGMLKAEMSLRSQWRADDRATARGILRTVKAEMPAYRRMARRGTAAEKAVAREALGILRGERERRERVRARKREFKRVRAKWGLGKRGRAKAMMRVGWRGFTTRVARFTSLPKKEPFTVLKKKVADSVTRLTSMPKKEPLTALKKKVADNMTRLASLPKTPFTVLKNKVADSVSRLTSLPKTPFSIFKKKKVVANDNDAHPRPPVVSEEPSEQEPSGSGEPLGGNAWADED